MPLIQIGEGDGTYGFLEERHFVSLLITQPYVRLN